jgi:hypothetical protein
VCGDVLDWRAAGLLGDILVGAFDTGVVVLCHCWCSGLVGLVFAMDSGPSVFLMAMFWCCAGSGGFG